MICIDQKNEYNLWPIHRKKKEIDHLYTAWTFSEEVSTTLNNQSLFTDDFASGEAETGTEGIEALMTDQDYIKTGK